VGESEQAQACKARAKRFFAVLCCLFRWWPGLENDHLIITARLVTHFKSSARAFSKREGTHRACMEAEASKITTRN